MLRSHFESNCFNIVGCMSSVCVSDKMFVLYYTYCLNIFSVGSSVDSVDSSVLICLTEQRCLVLTNSALLTIFPSQIIYFVFYLKQNFSNSKPPRLTPVVEY